MPSTRRTSSSFDCSWSGTWLEMVRATGISTAAVAVFSIHMDRSAANAMRPKRSLSTRPREVTMDSNASLLVIPCFLRASARNRLPRISMMMGLDRVSKA